MPSSANFYACLQLFLFCCRCMVSCRGGCCFSAPRSGSRTERACPCPFPKEWYHASCSRGMGKISVRLCGCYSISSVSARCSCCCSVPCSGPKTERACTCPSPRGWCRAGCGRGMGSWCRIFVGLCECCSFASASCRGSCCCSVPCSGPKTERACTCPFPKEWYRAGCGRDMSSSCGLVVKAFGCCSICLVAWVVSCPCVGGLCLPWRVVSLLPSLRLPRQCSRVGCLRA